MLTCNTSVRGGYQKMRYLDSFGQQGKIQMDRPTDPGFLMHLDP